MLAFPSPSMSRDEWVRVMALAVGPYDGRIHLGAVAADFKLVRRRERSGGGGPWWARGATEG